MNRHFEACAKKGSFAMYLVNGSVEKWYSNGSESRTI
jgi:hypothetical protein